MLLGQLCACVSCLSALCREQLRSKEKLVVREAAEAVIKIQQAAVKSRQGSASLDDVQSAVDYYAKILDNLTGGSASGGLKPGDQVIVPSMGQVNPLPATVKKVGGADRGGSACHAWGRLRASLVMISKAAFGVTRQLFRSDRPKTMPYHQSIFELMHVVTDAAGAAHSRC